MRGSRARGALPVLSDALAIPQAVLVVPLGVNSGEFQLGALPTPSWYGHVPRLKGLLLVANWIGRQRQHLLAAQHQVHSMRSSLADAASPYWKRKLGKSPLAAKAKP